MKSRRNIIISFLLCACLIVGVGYATLADILDVNGTAEYGLSHDFDSKVSFKGALAIESEGNMDHNNSASVSETNEDKVTFTVLSMADANDKAYFRFRIENSNETDVDIYLSSYGISGTGNPENVYTVKYAFSKTELDTANAVAALDNYVTAETTADGTYDPEKATTLDKKTDGNNGFIYLYIEVSFTGGNKPAAELVTATFALEFGVDNKA